MANSELKLSLKGDVITLSFQFGDVPLVFPLSNSPCVMVGKALLLKR